MPRSFFIEIFHQPIKPLKEYKEGVGVHYTVNKNEGVISNLHSVYTNKESNVFHKEDCSRLGVVDDLIEFDSPQEAMKSGGLPCNYCNPPSVHKQQTVDKAYTKTTSIKLRSSFKILSLFQVQLMPNISIREIIDFGFHGHSTIKHSYQQKSISGDKVVVDYATGLMWHQNGSGHHLFNWREAKGRLDELNSKGYAGYHDWRIPTIEEAASLLEQEMRNKDLYISPAFSDKQEKVWTGDKDDSKYHQLWVVSYLRGTVTRTSASFNHFIRPVSPIIYQGLRSSGRCRKFGFSGNCKVIVELHVFDRLF